MSQSGNNMPLLTTFPQLLDFFDALRWRARSRLFKI